MGTAASYVLGLNDGELIRQMGEKIVVVGAGLNIWIMLGIAREARSCYANKTV